MINSNLSITSEKGSDLAKCTIKKELSINNLEDIKSKLIKAIKDHKEIEIVLKKIDYFDLPGLQLLVSARKTIINQGKKISFSLDFSDEMETIFKNSGFNALLN